MIMQINHYILEIKNRPKHINKRMNNKEQEQKKNERYDFACACFFSSLFPQWSFKWPNGHLVSSDIV